MDVLVTLQPIFVIIFVYATMIYMGFSMTLKDIGNQFKHPRPIIMAIILNIVISPLLALGFGTLLGLSGGMLTSIVLINLFAGAPAGPKNVDLAHGDRTLAVATVFALSLAVLVVVPFTSQLFFQDVTVNPVQILLNLIILILIPLSIGLVIRAKLPKVAKKLAPLEMKLSNIFMILVLIVYLIPNISNIVAAGWQMVGASALIILVTFGVSWLLTFGSASERKTVSLITITKNFGVALSMSSLAAFSSMNLTPDLMTYVIMLLVISLPLSLLLRKVGGKKQLPDQK